MERNKVLSNEDKRRQVSEALLKVTISYDERKQMIMDVIPEFKACDECDHENAAHCYFVFDHIMKVVDDMPRRILPRLAALFHDIAKPECKIKGEDRCHFWGHEEKGEIKTRKIMESLGYHKDDIDVVTSMVRYHDTYINKTPELFKEVVLRIGKENIDDFCKLQIADLKAHASWYSEKYQETLKVAHENYSKLLENM